MLGSMPDKTAIGLVVNPISGMGGSVGLKGTDGADVLREAISRGARPLAGKRAARALEALKVKRDRIRFIAAPGPMGEDLLDRSGFEFEVAGRSKPASFTSDDTLAAAEAIERKGVELLLFAGGDGTARDLLAAIGERLPQIGIPCGVKMYSAGFAISPEAAGWMARDAADLIESRGFLDDSDTIPCEVMDIDESDYRKGRMSAKLFGYSRCPRIDRRLQGPKARARRSERASMMAAAGEIVESMQPGRVYLIGPGNSAKAVLDILGLEGTLLGVDAVLDRKMIGSDLSADEITRIVGTLPVGAVLGIVGGQGFVIGRGNQQITPAILRRIGRAGLIVMSSEEKLRRLAGESLLVDTGDPDLDREMEGFVRVRAGAGRSVMMRLSAGQ